MTDKKRWIFEDKLFEINERKGIKNSMHSKIKMSNAASRALCQTLGLSFL